MIRMVTRRQRGLLAWAARVYHSAQQKHYCPAERLQGGRSVRMEKFLCPICGKPVAADDAACAACGTPLDWKPTEEDSPASASPILAADDASQIAPTAAEP